MYRDGPRPSRKTAEFLAVEALSFLSEEPERLRRFLALTGINPQHLRAIAGDPSFLAAVLEHVTGEPALLEAFAAKAGRTPDAIEAARVALAGPGWERDTA